MTLHIEGLPVVEPLAVDVRHLILRKLLHFARHELAKNEIALKKNAHLLKRGFGFLTNTIILQPFLPQRPDVVLVRGKSLQETPEQVLVLILDLTTHHSASTRAPLEKGKHAVR